MTAGFCEFVPAAKSKPCGQRADRFVVGQWRCALHVPRPAPGCSHSLGAESCSYCGAPLTTALRDALDRARRDFAEARRRAATLGLADAETAVTRCRRCDTPADAWSLRDGAPCERCGSPLLVRAGGAAAEGTTVAADGVRPVEPAPSGSRPGTEVDNERETQ